MVDELIVPSLRTFDTHQRVVGLRIILASQKYLEIPAEIQSRNGWTIFWTIFLMTVEAHAIYTPAFLTDGPAIAIATILSEIFSKTAIELIQMAEDGISCRHS
jgi:hypothetical protein